MSDITDKDRRAARQWAEDIYEMSKYDDETPRETRAAVKCILATVYAPEPTLAERLREQFYDPEPTDEQYGIILDAEQMEQDAEDRQEWNRRITEQVATLARERDEARAEVERLTAEQDTEALHNHDWLAGMKDATRYAINATRPDPDDVQPGEAWIVEVEGERRTAVKDRADIQPWNTVNADGWLLTEDDEDVTLITRLVPAPRTITNHDDLDQAKRRTLIRDARGVVCERDGMGNAWTTFNSLANQRPHIALPATVLWEPVA